MISQWVQPAAEAMKPNPGDGVGRVGKRHGQEVSINMNKKAEKKRERKEWSLKKKKKRRDFGIRQPGSEAL